jgi:O-antigen/teichoic acid export membrane protein
MSLRRFRLKEMLARSAGGEADLDRLVTRGARDAFFIQVAGAVLAFGLQWTLARLLGVERFGVYAYSLSWLLLLAMVGALGFDHAMVRFASAYAATGEWSRLRGFLARSHQVVFVSSSVVMAATLAVVWALRERLDGELERALIVAAVSIPVMSLGSLPEGGLRAFKRFTPSLVARDIAPPLLILLAVVGTTAAWRPPSGPVAVALHLLVNAGILVATASLLIRVMPRQVLATAATYRTAEWVRGSLPFLLLAGFFVLLKQTDIIMVGTLLGRAEAGVYAVAGRFAILITFGLKSVNAILTPLISQLHATARMDDLQRLVSRAARMIFVFTLLTCGTLFLVGDWALGLFGEEFRAGNPILRLLLVGQAVNALAGSVGHLLTMTGSQRLAAVLAGSSALLNVALNFAFIPLWGAEGAAVATVLSTIAWNAAAVVAVRRRLGINPIVTWSR